MAKITMREAISEALMEEMDRDPAVFIIGEEVGVWGGTYAVTKGFYDKYGVDRVKDTPIAENAIIGAAIGAAMVGTRPVAELMTINFAFSAMDYVVNQAPKLHYMFGGQFKVPLVIRAVGGGGRQLGATHSQTPDAIFAHFPGLKVVSPGTPEDAKGLLKSAIRSDDPVLFIEHATMYQVRGDVPDEEYLIPIGKSKVQREGSDVTIVTYCKGRKQTVPSLSKRDGNPTAWVPKLLVACMKKRLIISMHPFCALHKKKYRFPITARLNKPHSHKCPTSSRR